MPRPVLASSAAAVAWLRSRGVTRLVTDSRSVAPGDAFIAWPGYAHDARQYVRAALAAGARAAIVEAQGVERHGLDGLDGVALWSGLKAASGEIAGLFMGQPSHRLDVIACTGTNGKTSTAWWTAQALSRLGRRCGVVGTLGVGEPPDAVAAGGLTTPDPIALQAAFARFAARGFQACAIEASSIGIVEHRLAGTRIAVAQFTNFTQDHLDYHGTMEAYWSAKDALFRWPGLRAAVVNIDDAYGARLAGHLQGRGLELWTCSLQHDARLRATGLRHTDTGLAFELQEDGAAYPVRTALIGDYNAQNLLAVIGALRALGVPMAQAAGVGEQLTPVPGRMQRVDAPGGPEVIVDYAHTPDALEKALLALRPVAARRGGTLWCVFGCGGNRDPGKRPLMGAVAASHAQRCVVTSDNPRHEQPEAIVEQVLAGMPRGDAVQAIVDRRAAIEHAVRSADARDVILLAGKGHEDYQEVAGLRQPFSDVEEARRALAEREVKA
jgi:UDP-N-acetylmuramoyl-L-alanyl-D-glutamate--2,6-diaminopimelate ligase